MSAVFLISSQSPLMVNDLAENERLSGTPTGTGTVTGFVYDEVRGVPLGGALVFVIVPNGTGTHTLSTSTDWIGHYRLTDVHYGANS